MDTSVFNIGIVGLGPKGFYGFERLLAEIHNLDDSSDICIHLFNETDAFATGWIYDINQPEYLLMNYPNKYIAATPANSPNSIIPIPSFSSWRSNFTGKTLKTEDAKVAPRAAVGRYLKYYFNLLLNAGSSRVKIKKHTTKVTGILKKKTGFHLATSNKVCDSINFKTVLITTGHSPAISSTVQTAVGCAHHIPFVYPFDEKLKPVKAVTTVLCKGIGLTAIDTILGLTEGRGGKFQKLQSGGYTYIKSGNEPFKIMPYSRSGVPIIPRGIKAIQLKQTSFFLKHLVEETLNVKQPLDFEEHILPAIQLDIEAEYYHRIFKQYDFKYTPTAAIEIFCKARNSFHKQFPKAQVFTAETLLYPKLTPQNNTHNAVANFWEFWIQEASKTDSPFAAAVAAWRFIADDFNRLYSADLLTSDSKTQFQNNYFGLFNRVAYGPPVKNIQKMIALMQAGILDFSQAKSPQIIDETKQCYLQTDSQKLKIDFILDARLPRSFSKNASVLFNRSTEDSLFSPSSTQQNSEVRCTQEGHPISPSETVEKDIVLYGTPTEHTLFDNDTLSRKQNDTASNWAKHTITKYNHYKNCLTHNYE